MVLELYLRLFSVPPHGRLFLPVSRFSLVDRTLPSSFSSSSLRSFSLPSRPFSPLPLPPPPRPCANLPASASARAAENRAEPPPEQQTGSARASVASFTRGVGDSFLDIPWLPGIRRSLVHGHFGIPHPPPHGNRHPGNIQASGEFLATRDRHVAVRCHPESIMPG